MFALGLVLFIKCCSPLLTPGCTAAIVGSRLAAVSWVLSEQRTADEYKVPANSHSAVLSHQPLCPAHVAFP